METVVSKSKIGFQIWFDYNGTKYKYYKGYAH